MRYFFAAILTLFCFAAFSQKLLPTPRNVQSAYTKGTRSADGRPGKNYWQNTARYDLSIQFDPSTRLLTGTVDIEYINKSPDTLRRVYFKLYPNYYKSNAPRQSPVDASDLHDGVKIDSMWINAVQTASSQMRINATNAYVDRQMILPGQKITFRIAYHYTLNKGSHMRTGEIEPNAAFIAYFFPRIAVYDDIDGWNTIPYTGTQEFYNDFCHFKASITVPSGFVVWATGDLTNAGDVLAPVYHQRLQQAKLPIHGSLKLIMLLILHLPSAIITYGNHQVLL